MSSGNTEPTLIQQKEPTDFLETLGVWTSPSGSMSKQFKTTSEKLRDIIINRNAANISSIEASLLIPIYIHTKLRYIFASTSFSEEQCANLEKIYLPTIISKMGMNRKTAIPILHGSHKFGGQQIPTS